MATDTATPDDPDPGGRPDPRSALLDAAERLLTRIGYPDVTTRRLAGEAGINHGLVHYYFGSMEELFLQTFERFTERLIQRQRELYSGDEPFVDKWRTAMRYMEDDLAAGYPKISFELSAMALNHPGFQERLQRLYARWWDVLAGPITEALEDGDVDQDVLPADAAVAFVFAYTVGTYQQRLVGFDCGHTALRGALDRAITSLTSPGRSALQPTAEGSAR